MKERGKTMVTIKVYVVEVEVLNQGKNWPAISKDWSVEVGRKGKDPSALLQSPEALSTHMECHTLYQILKKKKHAN